MPNNKPVGDQGELEVVELVKCPNCDKMLMVLITKPGVSVSSTRYN